MLGLVKKLVNYLNFLLIIECSFRQLINNNILLKKYPIFKNNNNPKQCD